MLKRPQECSGCPLHDNNLCSGFAPPFGKGSLGVLVIAEALGEHEAREGRPLVPRAQAGSLFARALRRMKIDEQQLRIMNTVNCRPVGNKLEGEWYEEAAIDHCRRYIDEAIARFRPRALLTLGNVALRASTGLAGDGRSVSALRGYCLPSATYATTGGKPIPVVPSYHPSYISRGQEKYLGVLMHDIGKAISVARGELVEGRDFIYDPFDFMQRDYIHYNTNPTEYAIREMLQEIASKSNLLVAYDIETNFTKKGKGEDEYELEADDRITQIQFSLRPGSGIALPWTPDTLDVARRVLGSPNPKAAHNGWRFDNPILRASGIEILGVNYDTMTMFHHLQPDLPADLQFVGSLNNFPFPWKHFADSDLAFYGIADVDAVQRIVQKLPDDMRKRGVWDSYMEMVVGLQPILEGMQNRGIRIDLQRREEFRLELEDEKAAVNSDLQSSIPEPVKPKQTYKDWPHEASAYVKQIQQANIIIGPKGGRTLPVVKIDRATADHHILLSNSERADLLTHLGGAWRYTNGSLVRVDPFLPNSTAHLKKLITYYKEPVPLNLDYDETTERPELEKMLERLDKEAAVIEKKKNPRPEDVKKAEGKRRLIGLVEKSIEYRKLNKIASTYLGGKWTPEEDGKVHTEFTFAPASWQLSSRDPNVQNYPAHGDLAEKFKEILVASPGHTLITADYAGCHLKTLAFEMEDLSYYRMACIDGHSTIGLIAMKLIEPEKLFEMTDEEWLDRCRWFKSDPQRAWLRQKRFKPGLLGIQLGLMGRKLWSDNRSGFKNKEEAQKLIDLIKSIFPKIPKWQSYIRDLAHRQGYLMHNYGGIRWFWSMRKWDAKKQEDVPGDDAEAALAYKVQGNAFGKIREAMLDLAAEGLDEKYGMHNTIHDNLDFDCPNEHLEEGIHTVKRIMEAPARKLINPTFPGGLIIPVEIKIGPNKREMKEIKL